MRDSRMRQPTPPKTALPLPPAALTALHAGDKAEAIRRVQASEGVDLNAATDAVEAVLAIQPRLKAACETGPAAHRRGLGTVLLIILAMGAVVVWVLFKHR